MAELADAKDLGSFTSRCAGLSPVTRISFAHGMIEADHTVGIFIESSKTKESVSSFEKTDSPQGQ